MAAGGESHLFDRLTEQERKFVEAIAAGMTGVEAAGYCGSEATSRGALAVFASRWRARAEIAAAIDELRRQHDVEDEGMWGNVKQALRQIIQDSKGNSLARVKACELYGKFTGRMQPERHVHAHAHAHAEVKNLEPGAERRLTRIAIRDEDLRGPRCGEAFKGLDALPPERNGGTG